MALINIIIMKSHLIYILIFFVSINTQSTNTQINPSSSAVSPPNASTAFIANNLSDQAKISSSGAASANVALPPSASKFNAANNVWNYMQKQLNGGCCSDCNKICGFAINVYNSNYYLSNVGNFFILKQTNQITNAQLFQLNQNADCTWSIQSNTGLYLSASSTYQGPWVGSSPTIGLNERWYIERNVNYVQVQSAAKQFNYWRGSSAPPYYLGYSYGFSTRFSFEFYPCTVKYGWNW